jgi:hypothetical protein
MLLRSVDKVLLDAMENWSHSARGLGGMEAQTVQPNGCLCIGPIEHRGHLPSNQLLL